MRNLRIMSDVDVARRIVNEADSAFGLVCSIRNDDDNLPDELSKELIALFDAIITFRCNVENVYYNMED